MTRYPPWIAWFRSPMLVGVWRWKAAEWPAVTSATLFFFHALLWQSGVIAAVGVGVHFALVGWTRHVRRRYGVRQPTSYEHRRLAAEQWTRDNFWKGVS